MDETGWRWSHALDAFSLIPARPGQRVYLTSGAENRTYRGVVRPDGTLGDLQTFVERGGESVAVDRDGSVYVANGQVFVYRPTGELSGRIDVPERPTGVRFGGRGRPDAVRADPPRALRGYSVDFAGISPLPHASSLPRRPSHRTESHL